MNNETLLQNLRNVPDFPVPGIQFKDVSTLYKNPRCLKIMVNELYDMYKDKGITKVVGIESRGFVVGAALAYKLGAGFVMCRKPGKLPADLSPYLDPETGLLPLGDMAISYERAEEQAKEFGHSTKRELGYLTIHSVLHLLGYDHVDEGPMKKQMRGREDAICAMIDLQR